MTGLFAILQVTLMVAGPLAVMAAFQRRSRAPWGLVGWGALAFVASQVVHVPLLWMLPSGLGLGARAVVLGLLAGLCEESARWVMFRALRDEGRGTSRAILAGLGHGGVEAMLLGALVAASLAAAQGASAGGPEESAAAALVLAAPLSARASAVVERVFAVTCHVGMSVLVERSVRTRAPALLLLSILFHAGLDASAVYLSQARGVWSAEAAAGGFAVAGALVIALALRAEPRARAASPDAVRAAPAELAVVTRGLGRVFGERRAVGELSLEVPRGQVLALLGPNGAGKTTTVRMLSALLEPTEGAARVAGAILGEDDEALRLRIGVAPEAPGLWERLTARQNLEIYADIYGLAPDEREARIADVTRRLGIDGRLGEKVGTFSKGMRQKTALSRALLHKPEVLFLDEPTSGLDPSAAREVKRLVEELRDEGKTILLTTHRLEEIEELADRVVILRERLVAEGTVEELRRRLYGRRALVRVEGEGARDRLASVPGVTRVEPTDDGRAALSLEDGVGIPALVRALVAEGLDVLEVTADDQSLEQVYLDVLKRAEGAS